MTDTQNAIRLVPVVPPNEIILVDNNPNLIALAGEADIPGGFKPTPGSPTVSGRDINKGVFGSGGKSGLI